MDLEQVAVNIGHVLLALRRIVKHSFLQESDGGWKKTGLDERDILWVLLASKASHNATMGCTAREGLVRLQSLGSVAELLGLRFGGEPNGVNSKPERRPFHDERAPLLYTKVPAAVLKKRIEGAC